MKSLTLRLSPVAAAFVAVVLAAPEAGADQPSVDLCLSANEEGLKLREEHKLVAARKEFLVCSAASCPSAVRRECTRLVEDVRRALPTIVFEAKDAAGGDRAAVRATVDGRLLAEKLDGTALEVDPGEHSFSFDAAGASTQRKLLVIRQGEKNRRERIVFEAGPAVSPSPPPVAEAETSLEPPASHASSAPSVPTPLGTQRSLAIAAGAVGVAALAAGAVFGLVSLGDHNAANRECPAASPLSCASQDGIRQWGDARTMGNISTVAFVVGGGVAAVGATLWLTSKPGDHAATAPQVGLGLGQLLLRGSF